jgi:catechol 2,3-dioxygenase-like lactoylglutathione lyase family enzyme
MIRGGHALVYVSDMDRAVRFWVETMGAKLVHSDPHWSMVDAGGVRIGLHPASKDRPAPGTAGAIGLGLEVQGFEEVVAVYENRGVKFDVTITPHVKLAWFSDPDGNRFYLSAA